MKKIFLPIIILLFAAVSLAGNFGLVKVPNPYTGKLDYTLDGSEIYNAISTGRGNTSYLNMTGFARQARYLNLSSKVAAGGTGGGDITTAHFNAFSTATQGKFDLAWLKTQQTAYSTARQAEINARVTTSTFSGYTAKRLSGLHDVSLSGLAYQDFLVYNSIAGSWENKVIGDVINLDTLGDVTAPSPNSGDALIWNGSAWTSAPQTVAVGSVTVLYLDSSVTIADNQALSPAPSSYPEETDTVTIDSDVNSGITFLERFISPPLGRTTIPAGTWYFHSWAKLNTDLGANYLVTRINKRVIQEGMTGTFTGAGATRTFTVTGGTPFVPGDATASILTASLIETPTQTAWISGYTSSSEVTVTLTDPSFVNVSDTPLNAMYYLLFSHTSADITGTAVVELEGASAQSAFTGLNPTDRLVAAYFGQTDSPAGHTISLYHGGASRYSHIESTLTAQHNDLAGLNDGDDYEHLTATEKADIQSKAVFQAYTSVGTKPAHAPSALVASHNTSTASHSSHFVSNTAPHTGATGHAILRQSATFKNISATSRVSVATQLDIGTPATRPHNITLNGEASRSIGLPPRLSGVGNMLTIAAGDSTAGRTDSNGGYLQLAAGKSTGSGESAVLLAASAAGINSTATGTLTNYAKLTRTGLSVSNVTSAATATQTLDITGSIVATGSLYDSGGNNTTIATIVAHPGLTTSAHGGIVSSTAFNNYTRSALSRDNTKLPITTFTSYTSIGREQEGVANSLVVSHNALGSAHSGHFTSTSNPHSVTAAQAGAPTTGQFDNFSTATQIKFDNIALTGGVSSPRFSAYSANRTSEYDAIQSSLAQKVDNVRFSVYSGNRVGEYNSIQTSLSERVDNIRFSIYSGNVAAGIATKASAADLTAHTESPTPAGGHPAAGNSKEIQYNLAPGTFAGAALLNYTGGMTRIGDATVTPTDTVLQVVKDLATTAVNYVVKIINNVTTTLARASISFGFNSGTVASIDAVQNSAGRNSALVFRNMTGAALRDAMVITGNKIGIGTANPLGMLHLQTGDTVPVYLERNSNDANAPALFYYKSRGTVGSPSKNTSSDFIATINAAGYDGTQYITSGSFGFRIMSSAATLGVKTNNVPIGFRISTGITATSERLRVDPLGKVGIATTAPTSQLHVVGLPVYGGATMAAARATITGLTRGAFWEYSTAGLRQLGVY